MGVLTGRVEQGAVRPGEEVKFLPTHTDANSCTGKVFTVEMHHKRIEHGAAGDNIGMNVKALNKENMPREIKCGYSPIGHVRCGRAACRLVKINWKMGKETGGEKAEGATALKTNDAAEGVFEPQQPMVVDSFDKCEGLSRIAFMDGNSAVMLGKVMGVNFDKDW